MIGTCSTYGLEVIDALFEKRVGPMIQLGQVRIACEQDCDTAISMEVTYVQKKTSHSTF